MSEVTGKEMITKFLDRIAITARVGVETGEFSNDEILNYIKEYGNKQIVKTLEMPKSEFALVALMELFETSKEIEMMEREGE